MLMHRIASTSHVVQSYIAAVDLLRRESRKPQIQRRRSDRRTIRRAFSTMTLSRLLFTLLIVLAAVAQLGRAIPTGGTEEAATENKTPEGHKTKEQLLEEYVHQTKEGDCHEGHCNACKSEEACVATGACMWCAYCRTSPRA